ncbi:MAG TPA: hypothetical protein DDZ51_26365 [Planctomycetaceae bacterium]|nr:hypothetical protein [Planctomycetaceae bacterium]
MQIECIDLFAGAGGLSLGLRQAGFEVRVAVDSDSCCEETYKYNHPETRFILADISTLEQRDLQEKLSGVGPVVLAGGPPCQLFSKLNQNAEDDPKGVMAYIQVLSRVSPDYAVFENVPAIVRMKKSWSCLINAFMRLGYSISYGVLAAKEFGVPQKRQRLIVIASKRGQVQLPTGRARITTVRKAIGHLPEEFGFNADHFGMNLGAENLRRILAISEGGTSRSSSESFSDSYSRMEWDNLSPTITTKCISFSNGRFGHPCYARALTVHEASLLQGFPRSFRFRGSLWQKARQVGNAVPPPVGRAIASCIIRHAKEANNK